MSFTNVQTRRGQAGLLAVAFTTPFLVVLGTGGYAQAAYQESTGNTNFVIREKSPTSSQISIINHSRMVNKMKDDYGLGVDQLSKLIGVSRPTIYTWLRSEAERVQESHTKYVESLYDALEQKIDDENKPFLGKLLRRKLDSSVVSIFRGRDQSAASLENIANINFKLKGLKRSELLREQLANKKAMI